jgi:hypothetical protein
VRFLAVHTGDVTFMQVAVSELKLPVRRDALCPPRTVTHLALSGKSRAQIGGLYSYSIGVRTKMDITLSCPLLH